MYDHNSLYVINKLDWNDLSPELQSAIAEVMSISECIMTGHYLWVCFVPDCCKTIKIIGFDF
jgi:hypothetical protein